MRRLFESFRPAREKPQASTTGGALWLVAGLGNPGERYHRSRHNLGFMVIELLARQMGIRLDQRRFKAMCGKGELDGQAVMLMQPQTFMNLSGESVVPLLGYFKLPAERLIVIHDELDLEPGTVRIKRGGGDAGHRGIRSIIGLLGSGDFIRVRIGVGHAPADRDSVGYLLEQMDAAAMNGLRPALERAADAVRAIVADGVERAMNKVNQRA